MLRTCFRLVKPVKQYQKYFLVPGQKNCPILATGWWASQILACEHCYHHLSSGLQEKARHSRTMATAVSSSNKLGSELSPYLRQHKDNPVAWYPWGKEAIEVARRENKMIFLSIGYSTCHWCHVMERESFESEEVAKIMNDNFVNIKVDREERPDIDKVYMTFVQATTGGGGWPLSAWLTPSLHPVFGGTYFPPDSKYGRPGFKQVLTALSTQWSEEGEDMGEAGRQVTAILDSKLGAGALKPMSENPPPALLAKLYAQLQSAFDPELGGFSKAPKFPQPSNLLTLLHLTTWKDQTSDRKKRGLEMVTHTLDMMDKGGIHDHVSQGFARYSTDRNWHVPHFEKMLYDQAQLVMAYTAAAQLTGSSRFKEVVADIVTYVSRDLTHPSGGFYSAEDADSLPNAGSSQKLEGAFCVWSWAEVEELLGAEEVEGHTLAALVQHEFHMEEDGNVGPAGDPHGELQGQNVLTRLPVVQPLCEETKYREGLEKARQVLFDARLKRPRPGLDTKILASWNSLMVSALARAGASLKDEKYLKMAEKAGAFLVDHMVNPTTGTMLRSLYGSGDNLEQLGTPIQGFLEDYSNTVQAMLDLYTATLDESWLELAEKLQKMQDTLFLDKEQGGYFASREGDPEVLLRLKDDQDGAEPSANSVSAMNLLRLGKILGSKRHEEEGLKVLRLFGDRLQQLPRALPAMAEAVLFHQSALPVLVVAGSLSKHPLLDHVRTKYIPSLAILGAEGRMVQEAHSAMKDIAGGDEQAVYLMQDSVLGEKITTIGKLQEMLEQ